MIHPAFAIDLEAASARFHASLFGGDYWDELAVAMRPDLKQIGDEHLDYTFDACIDHDLAEEGVDPRSPEGIAALRRWRSEEHTSELQSLMRISYAVFCLKNKKTKQKTHEITSIQTHKLKDI